VKTIEIPLKQITPAPFQPRKEFPTKGLQELADSMKAQGQLQPVVVRPKDGAYQLIAGERRLRAAQMLGWKEIRAEVREMEDREAMEKSAVENFHRANLTSIEGEDIVFDLWAAWGPNGTGDYKIMRDLSREIALDEGEVSHRISAKSARHKLGFGVGAPHAEDVSTYDLKSTAGVEDRSIRRSMLAAKVGGKIGSRELPDYAKAVKDAPKPLAEAVVKRPDRFTPQVTEKIKEIKSSEHQAAVIKEIEKHPIEPKDAEALAQSAVDYEDHETEILAAKAEMEQKFQKLLEMDAQSRAEFREKMKTPEMQKVGKAFGNIMAHTDFERGIEMEGCCCPQCGSGPEKMGWMCCGLGVRDAIKGADKRHREIMAENRKKREEAKAHGN